MGWGGTRSMANSKKPQRPPKRGPQKSVVRGRPRRRRSMYSRQSQRNGVLVVIVALFVGVAGIALANTVSSNPGSTTTAAQVTTSPTAPPSTAAPSPTPSQSTKPTPKPTPKPTEAATPKVTAVNSPTHRPRPSATPTPTHTKVAAAGCPPATTRVSRARASLRHPSAVPQSSVVNAGPNGNTFAVVDANSRVVTLYLHTCAEETTTHLAVAWMYVAGQLIPVETW